MSWESVISKIKFYRPSNSDEENPSPDYIYGYNMKDSPISTKRPFDPVNELRIGLTLYNLYHTSKTAKKLLEKIATGNDLWIAEGIYSAKAPEVGFISYISMDTVSDIMYFGKDGKLHNTELEMLLAHELTHAIEEGMGDLEGIPTEDGYVKYNLSSPNFNHEGPTVEQTNEILKEMGCDESRLQVGYNVGYDKYSPLQSKYFVPEKSYSEGKIISTVIADANNINPNVLDISSRGAFDEILFGGAGDDRMLSGAGDDFLYGNIGDDIIGGGSGSDLIQGGNGDGQSQNDGTDTVDYRLGDGGKPPLRGVTIKIDPSAAPEKVGFQTPITVSDDGYGDKDRLVSIEKIILTDNGDKLEIFSADISKFNLTNNELTIDMGHSRTIRNDRKKKIRMNTKT